MHYLHARQNILEPMLYIIERYYRSILQNRICTEPTKRLHERCQQMRILICNCERVHHVIETLCIYVKESIFFNIQSRYFTVNVGALLIQLIENFKKKTRWNIYRVAYKLCMYQELKEFFCEFYAFYKLLWSFIKCTKHILR